MLQLAGRAEIPKFEIVQIPPAVNNIPREVWKIEATIPQLSYLTHNFFRYYGKFPSVLARELIGRYSQPGGLVLDNMAGCGTSLVEASLLGRHSIGFDINPVAVLASNVKTRSRRVAEYKQQWTALNSELIASSDGCLFSSNVGTYNKFIPNRQDLSKWFSDEAVRGLARVRTILETVHDEEFKEFLLLGFAAILRRVSNAYDGEVRPHVNQTKRPRPVVEAFTGKIVDMLARLSHQDAQLPDKQVDSKAILWDARQPRKDIEGSVDLIISHPPYLNCFNYVPVYRWEMIWLGIDPKEHSSNEIVSWPAKPELAERYYRDNHILISSSSQALKRGGIYCIVIGDCSIKGVLEKTHIKFMDLCEKSGLHLEQVIYRDTHYATGRYAYEHRAEYNYEQGSEEKRDVILVCRKR